MCKFVLVEDINRNDDLELIPVFNQNITQKEIEVKSKQY